MARIWMSGFEAGSINVLSNVSGVGTNFNVKTTNPRTGAYSLYSGGTSGSGMITLPAQPAEIYFRVAVYATGNSGGSYLFRPFLIMWGASGAHLVLSLNPTTSRLEIIPGMPTWSSMPAALAAASVPLSNNAWTCLEYHILIHDTLGVVQVKQDGVMVIDLVGTAEQPVDTLRGGGGITSLQFASVTASPYVYRLYGYFDDIAINDTTGEINNSWPGRGGIYPMIPSGAGALTQFTPDSGDNHARVSDVPPDDDTSYVESAVLDTSDLYATAGVTPTDGTVSAVQWLARAKLTDSGEGNLRRLVRHDGVNYAGDDQGLDTSYRYLSEIMEKAPDETEWTLSKVNALEIGQQVG